MLELSTIIGKVICGTGHRPDKLGGYTNWPEKQRVFVDKLKLLLSENRPRRIISGMAQGWDTILALAAVELDIPLEVHLPYTNHGDNWPEDAKQLHKQIVDQAIDVTIVSKEYTKSCLQERNISMVRATEIVLALWNGTSGGTKNCIDYATKHNVPIVNVWEYFSVSQSTEYRISEHNQSKELPNFISTDISLDEATHTYTLSSDPSLQFVSCTTLLKPLFAPFEPAEVAAKLIQYCPKYKDRTIVSLMKEWKQSGEDGTLSHHEVEEYVLRGAIPSTPKGLAGKQWVDKILSWNKYDWYPEVIIFDKELRIAGMIDLILIDRETNAVYIFDWKTNKKIAKKGFRGKKGKSPLTAHLPDCEYTIYSLQLSLYRVILEELYGRVVKGINIIHLREDGYEVIPATYYSSEIAHIIQQHAPGRQHHG